MKAGGIAKSGMWYPEPHAGGLSVPVEQVGKGPEGLGTLWRHRVGLSQSAFTRIAFDCGYEFESAFNRAFKREYGVPPATWQKNSRIFASAAGTIENEHKCQMGREVSDDHECGFRNKRQRDSRRQLKDQHATQAA